MKNQRKIFWISFVAGIIIVTGVVSFAYFKESRRIGELTKMFPDWVKVEGKISSFSAFFPKEPKYVTQDIPVPNSNGAVHQELFALEVDKDTAFFVAGTIYPSAISGNAEENLRSSLDGMLNTVPKGQIVSSKFVRPIFGKDFLEFEIYGPTTDIYFKGRLYVSGNMLYQTNATFKKELYNKDVFDYFVKSFQIK